MSMNKSLLLIVAFVAIIEAITLAPMLLFDFPMWSVLWVVAVGLLLDLIVFSLIRKASHNPPYRLVADAEKGWFGFERRSGLYVGGGWYPRVEVGSDETIAESRVAIYYRDYWSSSSGYLTLTDRRLIFVGRRWFWFWTPVTDSVGLDSIASVRTSKRPLALSAMYFADGLSVQTTDGTSRLFLFQSAALSFMERVRQAQIGLLG
jgi:hypothetical protein